MAPEVYHFRTLGLNVANMNYNFINELSTVDLTSTRAIRKSLSL